MLGAENEPAVDWDTIAFLFDGSHHGRIEAVRHAVFEVVFLQNSHR